MTLWQRIKRLLKPHRHQWQPVSTDHLFGGDGSKRDIAQRVNMVLLCQTCACGAVRMYNGPALGWEIRK